VEGALFQRADDSVIRPYPLPPPQLVAGQFGVPHTNGEDSVNGYC